MLSGTRPDSTREWLEGFVAAIRGNDIAAGRALFADDAVGYGVITGRMRGLDCLVDEQWRPTWRQVAAWSITDHDLAMEDDDLAVLAFTWKRVNHDTTVVTGRATLILRRVGSGWLCTHSHLSATPQA